MKKSFVFLALLLLFSACTGKSIEKPAVVPEDNSMNAASEIQPLPADINNVVPVIPDLNNTDENTAKPAEQAMQSIEVNAGTTFRAYTGAMIAGLKGTGIYEGMDFYITVKGISESSTGSEFSAMLELHDDSNNLVNWDVFSGQALLTEAFTDKDGKQVFSTFLYIESIQREIGTDIAFILFRG